MQFWTTIFFLIFFLLLGLAAYKSYNKNRSSQEFIFAGLNIGAMLGFLTFAAALFSAFTFMGMPDFFRNHGVGAWTFLALSDGFMVFFMLWFAYRLRKKAKVLGYQGIAGMVSKAYGNKWAGYLMFFSAFVFLIPYVSIQIRGISIFLEASYPGVIPFWGWAVGLAVIMLIYSEIGGMKAIIYSDAIQALLLLLVIWIIGAVCLSKTGGLSNTFLKLEELKPELLHTPGPSGLFTTQFLIASAISIVLIPVTQPQFTTRLVMMKDLSSVHKMCYAVGFFAILVILPTAFIGFYGAINYPDANTSDFLTNALLHDQLPFVAALAVVGLFAACLSTTNAQIFALGTELRSLINSGTDQSKMRITKIALAVFTLIVLIFSSVMSNELALLAKVSFTGTSMVAPVVFGAILYEKPSKNLLYLSLLCLFVFIASLLNLIPALIVGWRLDILLYVVLAVGFVVSHFQSKNS